MKNLLVISLFFCTFQQAFGALATTMFCRNYPEEQKRIALVKKKGWELKDENQTEYLYGCLNLKWRDQLYNNLCLDKNNEINLPKIILFYFDGFGYYRPKEVKADFNAINVTGEEPAGLISNGYYALSNYIGKIKQNPSINWNEDVQFHYHSGSGVDRIQGIENAEVCYSSILKDLKMIEENYPELVQPKKVIMGHSNGGVNAINFVNHFAETDNALFDLLITIDPVPKVGGFIKSAIFSKAADLKINKPENIAKSFNFYEHSNDAILAGLIKIRGSQVAGVKEEREVYYANHVTILLNPIVTNTIVSEITELDQK
jgi:hypothetical protein